MASGTPRVVVVGGGISGLATAHHLLSGSRREGSPLEVVLLEASRRAGGKVATIEVGGLRVEAGPDSFVVRKPWAVELCRELGLEDRVIVPAASGAFVLLHGGLVALPERAAFGIPGSARQWLAWPGLSRRGRLRALGDLIRPSGRDTTDESLGALLRRRLGGEAARMLVEPLLAGLHAGDPMELSVDATFPELHAWERGLGSLIRGARAATKAADRPGPGRKPLFATVWGGLSAMTERLESSIGPGRLRLDVPVSDLSRTSAAGRWTVRTAEGSEDADAVVLATPAFESARLLSTANGAAAAALDEIPYASTGVVVLVYPAGTADRLPARGTGYVVPGSLGGVVTASTWVSRKWPAEEFGNRAVIRCFVGRAGAEGALAMSDEELAVVVRGEVEAVVPVDAAPEHVRVVRWNRAMPQYAVGHLDRLSRMEEALAATPGAFVTGAAYRGIGLADCVRQARETADRVRAYLRGAAGEAGEMIEEPGAHTEAIPWTR